LPNLGGAVCTGTGGAVLTGRGGAESSEFSISCLKATAIDDLYLIWGSYFESFTLQKKMPLNISIGLFAGKNATEYFSRLFCRKKCH